jgi:coenzyme F420-reducing hydrogenase gamma subunit
MKPKVAFFDFTSCEGCQLTVVDSLQTHLDLLDAVEIVQFREAISERGEDYAVAFIEGSITRPSDEDRLRAIRERAAVLVALGACAHLGGVNAIKNLSPLEEARRYVYGDRAEWYATYAARPISAVVPVDAFIPGCPIDRQEFIEVVKALLRGKKPAIPDFPMCVECKLKENVCLFDKGGVCAGPVTRSGCGAICPTYGDGCEGCRGLISNPNRDSMQSVLAAHGLTVDDIMARMTIFGAYQLQAMQSQAK